MSSQVVTVTPSGRPLSRRPPRVLLGIAGVLGIGFVGVFVTPYFTMNEGSYDQFWPRRWWLLAHLVPGTVALLLAPVQLWLGATRRHMRVHRRLGRLYIAAVAASSVAAVGLAFKNDVSWVYGAGLLGLAAAWLTTTGMAWYAIRWRQIEQHREWMIRSAVVTFAFVWFRVVLGTTIALEIGTFPERFVIAAWSCWSIPLLATEVLLQAGRLRPRAL